jgi:phenylalanyl-tRNA synthetase beta chain
MLASLRNNLAQGNSGLRLFELAHVFHADESSETTAREPGRLAVLLYGDRFDSAWPQRQGLMDYQDIKGVVEHLLAFLRLENAAFAVDGPPHPWLRPAVTVRVGKAAVGVMGRIPPEIADAAHARLDVWTAEMDLDALRHLHDAVAVTFAPLPVFPPVRRDITLAVPYSLPARSVLDAVAAMELPLLEETRLHDAYAPDEGDTRRLTFRLTFRHGKRPLEDAEVDRLRDAVATRLAESLPVTP